MFIKICFSLLCCLMFSCQISAQGITKTATTVNATDITRLQLTTASQASGYWLLMSLRPDFPVMIIDFDAMPFYQITDYERLFLQKFLHWQFPFQLIEPQNIPLPAGQSTTNKGQSTSPHRTHVTHWRRMLLKSGETILVLTLFRLPEAETRANLFKGQFFAKWADAFRNLNRWPDGDDAVTNDFEHPVMGATFILDFLEYSWRGHNLQIGLNRHFLITMSWATLYAAGCSFMFEFGPISEATIGVTRGDKQGLTDHVMTPVGGAIETVRELYFSKYITQPLLRSRHWYWKGFGYLSSAMTPALASNNILQFRRPWTPLQNH